MSRKEGLLRVIYTSNVDAEIILHNLSKELKKLNNAQFIIIHINRLQAVFMITERGIIYNSDAICSKQQL